jgi:drug/metabolite transporter (DMT)-like permease
VPATRPRVSPHLLLALTAFFWAAHWIVARAVHPFVSPVSLAFWRWVAAIAFLAPFAAPILAREWPKVRAAWPAILFFGTGSTVLYNAIGYVGIKQTTATNAVLFQSVTPALIPLFAFALFREHIRPRAAAGLALSFLGVLAIVLRLDAQALSSLRLNPGDLWLLANVALWALYTACLRWRPRDLDPLAFMLAVMLAGMLTGLPAYLVDFAAGGRFEANWGSVLGTLYLGLFPSVICYWMWNRGVAEVGPARAGVYLHLIPLFGALMAVALLGEELRLYHVVGIVLILLGIRWVG